MHARARGSQCFDQSAFVDEARVLPIPFRRRTISEQSAPPPERTVSQVTIEELIRRARAGDQSALEALFKRSQSLIDELASQQPARSRQGLDRPSDIAQETALRAFDRFSQFEGTTEAEWRSWLRQIFAHYRDQAFRNARRHKRDVRHTVLLDDSAHAVSAAQERPSQLMAHEETWRQTLAHIYELPEEQRRAIWLCHLKELPVADVARAMNKTEAAVAGLLRRGLHTLRRRAQPDPPEGEATAGMDASDGVAAALLMYLRRRDAGEHVDREAFCAEHASCANELGAMLQWIEHIEGIRPERSRT
jgi:RNA polymerase sigma-70 factor (ECF subfamily)